jgi:hypothetical protein
MVLAGKLLKINVRKSTDVRLASAKHDSDELPFHS